MWWAPLRGRMLWFVCHCYQPGPDKPGKIAVLADVSDRDRWPERDLTFTRSHDRNKTVLIYVSRNDTTVKARIRHVSFSSNFVSLNILKISILCPFVLSVTHVCDNTLHTLPIIPEFKIILLQNSLVPLIKGGPLHGNLCFNSKYLAPPVSLLCKQKHLTTQNMN